MNTNISKNLLNHIIQKNASPKTFLSKEFKIGSIVQILYKIAEGTKDKHQWYEGILIATKNTGLSKSMTLRRIVQGIGVEQIFFLNSPNMLDCKERNKSNFYKSKRTRRAKLYYLRKK